MKAGLERQARNEALFREVNERIAALDRKMAGATGNAEALYDFECECGRHARCDGRVRMTLAEYDTVRAQDDRFAVAPGHETNELEQIVERTERYLIVDKVPAAEEFVRDDPRGAPSA
jgi:hypothetical protein